MQNFFLIKVILYNYTLVTKKILHSVPLYMTHYESICQSGMTRPISYCSIATNQEMEVSVSQNTNIDGCWYGPITNLH